MKLLLEHADKEGIRYYEAYRKHGGYRAVEKAFKMTPEEIVEEVKKSGLRGRGGAARPEAVGVAIEADVAADDLRIARQGALDVAAGRR